MTPYELSLKIHEAALGRGTKMPRVAENAPVWSKYPYAGTFLFFHLDYNSVSCPDYTSAANSLPLLFVVEPGRELKMESNPACGVKVWFGYASGSMPEDMVGYGDTPGEALRALLCTVLEVEQ